MLRVSLIGGPRGPEESKAASGLSPKFEVPSFHVEFASEGVDWFGGSECLKESEGLTGL